MPPSYNTHTSRPGSIACGWPLLKARLSCLLLLPFLAVALYGNILLDPFHFDDKVQIEDNASLPALLHPAAAFRHNPYRPLMMMSLSLCHHLGGGTVFCYHLLNILLHALASILVYFLCLLFYFHLKDTPEKSRHPGMARGAVLVAALWHVLQPMNTQAVAYISGRASAMATFFVLLSFYFFFKDRIRRPSAGLLPDALQVGAAVAFYLLAMASKEIGIVLPCLLLAADYYIFSRGPSRFGQTAPALNYWRTRGFYLAPFFLIVATGLLSQFHRIAPRFDLSYLATQANVVFYYYINKLFFPFNQNIDVDYGFLKTFFNFPLLFSAVSLVSLISLACKIRFSQGILFFSVAWFFIALAPTSSILMIEDPVMEHRLYFPGVAFSFLLLYFFSKHPIPKLPFLLLVFFFFSSVTIGRNAIYKDKLTLWRDSALKAVHKVRPNFNYSKALENEGRWDEALIQYRKTLALGPSFFTSHARHGMGNIYKGKHLYQRAVEEYEEAIRLDPKHVSTYNQLGLTYEALGKRGEAENAYKKAIRLDPSRTEAKNNLAVLYITEGLFDEAYEKFLEIYRIDPTLHDVAYKLKALEPYTSKGKKN